MQCTPNIYKPTPNKNWRVRFCIPGTHFFLRGEWCQVSTKKTRQKPSQHFDSKPVISLPAAGIFALLSRQENPNSVSKGLKSGGVEAEGLGMETSWVAKRGDGGDGGEGGDGGGEAQNPSNSW